MGHPKAKPKLAMTFSARHVSCLHVPSWPSLKAMVKFQRVAVAVLSAVDDMVEDEQ